MDMCVSVYVRSRVCICGVPYKPDGVDGNEESQTEEKRLDREIYGEEVQARAPSMRLGGTLRFGGEDAD